MNAALRGRFRHHEACLFDFGFLEFHVLFRDRIIFALDHFLGHGAAVFLGHVEEAGIGSAFQLDFDSRGFGHFSIPGYSVVFQARFRFRAIHDRACPDFSANYA